MKKHLNIVFALAAGLLGGLVSRYIAPPAAFAQSQPTATKEIRAQSFVLVDPTGRTIATFAPEPSLTRALSLDPSQPRLGSIRLLDANGREIWSAGGSPFRAPSDR
jgi:hypothetical protein